jgi:uncharacterized protein
VSRRADVAFAGAACVVLAGYNNFVGLRPWHRRWYPVVNGCAAVAALGVAVASGLSAGDLGLGAGSAGGRAEAGIFGGRAGGGRVRAGRGDPGWSAAARRSADRGAGPAPACLPGAAADPGGDRGLGGDRVPGSAPGRAAPGAGGAFGYGGGLRGIRVWHIRPTVEALAVNRLAAERGARVLAVTGVVGGMAVAGAVLSLLRERSGSLAAPILLHLAANCTGPLASTLARGGTLNRGAPPPQTGRSGSEVTVSFPALVVPRRI